VVANELTNVELNEILNPASDYFRDYFNFVYDTSSYEFCSSSSEWFA
jgi:hypothetical protein